MKKLILLSGFMIVTILAANATKANISNDATLFKSILVKTDQKKKVTLVASGLTCSMCSKAIFKSLTKLDFVEEVKVDIEKSTYILSFKTDSKVNLAQIKKAVTDAGFGVKSLVYE
ncbi:MAG: heavy-metal-associated domain-containing protein [Chitinophagia bacterium]|jgi:copper chaperone CopZ